MILPTSLDPIRPSRYTRAPFRSTLLMDQGIPLYRINSHGSASPISRRATPVSNPRGHPNRVHSAATAPACCSTTCQPRGAHGTLPDGRGNTPPPLKGSVAATTGCRRRGRARQQRHGGHTQVCGRTGEPPPALPGRRALNDGGGVPDAGCVAAGRGNLDHAESGCWKC